MLNDEIPNDEGMPNVETRMSKSKMRHGQGGIRIWRGI